MTQMGEISGLSRREFQEAGETPKNPRASALNSPAVDKISISRETERTFGILSEWMDRFSAEELVRPEMIERARALIDSGHLDDESIILKAAKGLILEEAGIPPEDEPHNDPN